MANYTRDEILEVSDLADKLWETRRESLRGTVYEYEANQPPERDQRSLYLDLALFILENYTPKTEEPKAFGVVWEGGRPTEVEDGEGDRWTLGDDGYYHFREELQTLSEVGRLYQGYKVIR